MAAKKVSLKKNNLDRIPRKPLSDYNEVEGGLFAGIFAHGFQIWKVALDDDNQYGPHAMILLLVITATLTGGLLKLFEMFV